MASNLDQLATTLRERAGGGVLPLGTLGILPVDPKLRHRMPRIDGPEAAEGFAHHPAANPLAVDLGNPYIVLRQGFPLSELVTRVW
jgi:hypothetical protein